MFQSLTHAVPFWLWIVLVFLLYKGVRLMKPRLSHIQSFYVLAIFAVVGGFYGMENIKLVILFSLVGVVAGIMFFGETAMKADKKKGRVYLQGSILPLILGLILVISKIFYLYQVGILSDVAVIGDQFRLTSNFILGLVSGIYVGRAIKLTIKFANSEDDSAHFVDRNRR